MNRLLYNNFQKLRHIKPKKTRNLEATNENQQTFNLLNRSVNEETENQMWFDKKLVFTKKSIATSDGGLLCDCSEKKDPCAPKEEPCKKKDESRNPPCPPPKPKCPKPKPKCPPPKPKGPKKCQMELDNPNFSLLNGNNNCGIENLLQEIRRAENCEMLNDYFGDCYKNKEYYMYTDTSYYDLMKYLRCNRLPQPSNKEKKNC